MSRRRALLIVNPQSRQGSGDLAPLLAALRAGGIDVTLEKSGGPESLNTLLRERAADFDLVVLGGGDGTLRGATRALLKSGRPLGVLPLGTANDLARGLGLPADPLAAARVIATGVEQRIDLGRVNDHFFFNASSIGLGVRVTHALSHGVKQRWGALGYGRALLQALRDARPFSAEIVCDGRRLRLRSIQITVGNGRHYGGGMTVHVDATLDDQRLHVYSLPPQSLWRLGRLLPALRRGTLERHEDVAVLDGQRIEIRTRRPRMISADGELISRTPAHYEVVPAALAVIVPEQAEQAERQNVAQ